VRGSRGTGIQTLFALGAPERVRTSWPWATPRTPGARAEGRLIECSSPGRGYLLSGGQRGASERGRWPYLAGCCRRKCSFIFTAIRTDALTVRVRGSSYARWSRQTDGRFQGHLVSAWKEGGSPCQAIVLAKVGGQGRSVRNGIRRGRPQEPARIGHRCEVAFVLRSTRICLEIPLAEPENCCFGSQFPINAPVQSSCLLFA
jgi:hypothetical protein